MADVPGEFTPVLDTLARAVGLVGAAVWGRIWRYAQLDSGCCTASAPTIAADLGLSERCVRAQERRLIQHGLLEVVRAAAGRPIVLRPVSPEFASGVRPETEPLPRNEIPGSGGTPRNEIPGTPERGSDPPERNAGVPRNEVPTKRHERHTKRQEKREVPPADPPEAGMPVEELHPAVRLYHEILERWPSESDRPLAGRGPDWASVIGQTVGATPEHLARYADILGEWQQRLWDPGNIPDQLDRFSRSLKQRRKAAGRADAEMVDMSKFEPGGKYYHLFNRTTTEEHDERQ